PCAPTLLHLSLYTPALASFPPHPVRPGPSASAGARSLRPVRRALRGPDLSFQGCSNVEESPDTVLLEPPPTPPLPTSPRGSLLGRLASGLPSLLVFTALGGLLAWGHLTGWNPTRFSWFTGAAPGRKHSWCSQHNVPDSLCVECNPELMPRPKAFGWCQQHGVHECPLCHPEVAQLAARPQVTEADLLQAQRALDFADRPENNPGCKSHQRRIQ